MMADAKQYNGPAIPDLWALLFVGLRLSDNIDWSWWWVLSPLWISLLARMIVAASKHP